MNKLRDELNNLPNFEGLKRLQRPPMFTWGKDRDWDALCGNDDDEDVDDEANDNRKVDNSKLKKLEAEIKKEELLLYDPTKEDHLKTKIKIMVITCNLGGMPLGSGKNKDEEYQDMLDELFQKKDSDHD